MKKLRILVIDRWMKESENIRKDIFLRYAPSQYDLFLFTPKDKEDKPLIQGVFYFIDSVKDLEESLGITIYRDADSLPTDFEIKNMDEETFYEKIRQRFELTISKLTEVEKKLAA